MSHAPVRPRDPLGWCVALAAAFWLLMVWNLGIPSKPYFDEVHYLPAARELLELGSYANKEHPLLGKALIAAGIALFGDTPFGWRILGSVAGALALLAALRALWFASENRFATIAYGMLLASGFHLFVQARIAMLDIFMIAFLALAWWQLAAAMREPERGRWRLALAGIALGLAMGTKWNAVPLAMLPGLGFLFLRLRAGRRHLLLSRRGAPVPGVSLAEAAVWLGLVPLAVYALTFAPALYFAEGAVKPRDFVTLHTQIMAMQESVLRPHPYQSRWPEWVTNWRAIWYLYEPVDGAQRGILLVGNPLTMLLGLPALLWCVWQGAVRRRAAHGGVAVIYAVSLGLWLVADKPVQFYYHYILPSMALLAALALALAELEAKGWRKTVRAVLVVSVLLFAFYYPILAALPLPGPRSFVIWTWLNSWR